SRRGPPRRGVARLGVSGAKSSPGVGAVAAGWAAPPPRTIWRATGLRSASEVRCAVPPPSGEYGAASRARPAVSRRTESSVAGGLVTLDGGSDLGLRALA